MRRDHVTHRPATANGLQMTSYEESDDALQYCRQVSGAISRWDRLWTRLPGKLAHRISQVCQIHHENSIPPTKGLRSERPLVDRMVDIQGWPAERYIARGQISRRTGG